MNPSEPDPDERLREIAGEIFRNPNHFYFEAAARGERDAIAEDRARLRDSRLKPFPPRRP